MLGYICEMTGGQNPKPTSTPGQSRFFFVYFLAKARLMTSGHRSVSDSHCDRGYLLYGNFCYKFESESVKTWQDAEAHCVSEQAHLASFHSEEELSFLNGEQLTNICWST